jgi:hypothetical protein
MPIITYPLKWLESNFSSQSKTDVLLKPELENGTLNLHDYELTKVRGSIHSILRFFDSNNTTQSFHPGMHRYLPVRHSP